MNDMFKEILIQTTVQILGFFLIVFGCISIADRIHGFPLILLMFASLFIWSILVMLWRIRVKGR